MENNPDDPSEALKAIKKAFELLGFNVETTTIDVRDTPLTELPEKFLNFPPVRAEIMQQHSVALRIMKNADAGVLQQIYDIERASFDEYAKENPDSYTVDENGDPPLLANLRESISMVTKLKTPYVPGVTTPAVVFYSN